MALSSAPALGAVELPQFPIYIVWLVLGILVASGGGLSAYLLGASRSGRTRRDDGYKATTAIAVCIILAGALLTFAVLELSAASTGPYSRGMILSSLLIGLGIAVVFALVGSFAGLGNRDRREKDGWLVAGAVAAGLFTLWLIGRKRSNGNGHEEDEEEPEFEIELASGEEIEAEEREYIENILEMGETTAREVMTPRTDVVAVDMRWEPERIISYIADSRFSRFPIYTERIDDVQGILHLRDLLEFLARGEDAAKLVLSELAREAFFVPGGNKVDDVLRELQLQKSHMAIVLDEFGGMSGILTIEDLLEEIVGEIQDEHDDESKLVHARDDGSWVIDAQLPLDELAEETGLRLESETPDVDTVGGLVATVLGKIPDPQERFDYAGLQITVLSVEKNRILRVLVEQPVKPATPA